MTTTTQTTDIRDINDTLWRFEDDTLHRYCYAMDSDGFYYLASKLDLIVIGRYPNFESLFDSALMLI
jgi:hypothetical protein